MTFTGAGVLASIRGAALRITGKGKAIDLRDSSVQLGAFGGFEVGVEKVDESAVTIVAKDGKPHTETFYAFLSAWLELSPMWPVKSSNARAGATFIVDSLRTRKPAGSALTTAARDTVAAPPLTASKATNAMLRRMHAPPTASLGARGQPTQRAALRARPSLAMGVLQP